MKANSKTKHVNEHYIKQDSNHDELHRSRELAQGIVCTKPAYDSHDTDTTLCCGGYIAVITVKGVWLLLIKDGTIKPPVGGTYETDSTFSVLNLQQQPSWPVHISLISSFHPKRGRRPIGICKSEYSYESLKTKLLIHCAAHDCFSYTYNCAINKELQWCDG